MPQKVYHAFEYVEVYDDLCSLGDLVSVKKKSWRFLSVVNS